MRSYMDDINWCIELNQWKAIAIIFTNIELNQRDAIGIIFTNIELNQWDAIGIILTNIRRAQSMHSFRSTFWFCQRAFLFLDSSK